MCFLFAVVRVKASQSRAQLTNFVKSETLIKNFIKKTCTKSAKTAKTRILCKFVQKTVRAYARKGFGYLSGQVNSAGRRRRILRPARLKPYSPNSFSDCTKMLCTNTKKNVYTVMCITSALVYTYLIDKNSKRYNIVIILLLKKSL